MAVDLFIPHRFLHDRHRGTSLLFGSTTVDGDHVVVCCVALSEHESSTFEAGSSFMFGFGAVGVIRSGRHGEEESRNKLESSSTWFEISILNGSSLINISKLFVDGKQIKSNRGRVVVFSAEEFVDSSLLITRQLGGDNGMRPKFEGTFVDTIVSSLKKVTALPEDSKKGFILSQPVKGSFECRLARVLKSFFNFLLLYMSVMLKACENAATWFPEFIRRLLLQSYLCQQLCQREILVNSVTSNLLQKKQFTLISMNIVFAGLLDVFCGAMAVYFFSDHVISNDCFIKVMNFTSGLVNFLQSLIHWLMGDPAGLKLNIPLNTIISQFFLYHIHLWKTYIAVIRPIFSFCLTSLPYIGVFGTTFLLSGVNDLISLVTIHIYCFYGYMARIYHYHIKCLLALWRLFRGKKWNPETQRVESYTFDIHRLYIGTLLFTMLVFLLPTVVVYYSVFAALRITVLIVQDIISRFINILTVFPLYVIILRLLKHQKTAGDVCFSIMQRTEVLVLSLKVVQLPFSSVIKHTLPELKKFGEVLTWKEFIYCLLHAKIIYPL